MKVFSKNSAWIVFWAILIFGGQAYAGGDIYIAAPAETQVWLDEETQGTITDASLLLKNIVQGAHVVKAKNGNRLLVEPLYVLDGRTIELELFFDDAVRSVSIDRKVISASQAPSHGGLVIRSLPLHADIFLDGKSLGKADKRVFNIPAGSHTIRFTLTDQSLEEDFTLQSGETRYLKVDFKDRRIITSTSGSDPGPAVITIQTIMARKPALFPHRKHQQFLDCSQCHHSRDEKGNQIPYAPEMHISRCVSCHNAEMPNKELSSIKLAGHALCKGCHRLLAKQGIAGPIGQCVGCHPRQKQE